MQLSFIGWQVCYPGTRSRDIINNRQCGSLDKKVWQANHCTKTTEIFQTFEQRFYTAFDENMVQSGSEVAEIVKNIILSENPNLRYHTNKKFNPEQVKAKLSDPTVMFCLIWWTKLTLLRNNPYCSFYQRRWSLSFSMLYSFCKNHMAL